MADFHVLHWMPDSRLHIFHGYRDVIDSVVWGLRSLGHPTSQAVNRLRPGATHIVFGAQMMHAGELAALPEGSIIYNLEQLPGLIGAGREMHEFRLMAERFVIWDYSMVNVELWCGQFGAARVHHVPVGFAPVLCRIAPAETQDIDVLIYGGASGTRLAAVQTLCDIGLSTMFFCGLYDAARDALIARAKVVVNIGSNAHSGIFSIVRASYLLANRKAIVADIATVEADMLEAIRFVPLDQVPFCCHAYVQNDEARRDLEEAGFRAIARRDVRAFLASALARG